MLLECCGLKKFQRAHQFFELFSLIRKHIPSSKQLTDFTTSHENAISLWIGSCHYLHLAKDSHSWFLLLWVGRRAVGDEEQFSLSFCLKQSFLRDEAVWKAEVKNCAWIWKRKPRHLRVYIQLQNHQYAEKLHPSVEHTAAYLVPSRRKLNPRQFICICLRLTTPILQMKLEVKIDSLEQTVDVTKRVS